MRVSPACAPGSLAIVERVRSSVSWKSSAVYDGAGLAPAELGGLFAPMIPRTTIPVVTRDVRVARVDRTMPVIAIPRRVGFRTASTESSRKIRPRPRPMKGTQPKKNATRLPMNAMIASAPLDCGTGGGR